MEATRLFMEINGYNFLIDFGVVDAALQVARGELEIPQLAIWIEPRSAPILKLQPCQLHAHRSTRSMC